MPLYVANLERHLIPSPFLRINFLQVILQAVAQTILMWSDSDHDVVIAHYSNSDLIEDDASDPEENNHINIPVRKTRSGRNVPFLNNIMVTAFCTTDSFE